MKPLDVLVSDGNIYISEAYRVHIFSLADFKHKKSFGKKGEGPQEFNPYNRIYMRFHNHRLYIDCQKKVVVFDHEGNYLSEYKSDLSKYNLFPTQSGHFCNIYKFDRKTKDRTFKIAVLDKDKKVTKILHEETEKIKLNFDGPRVYEYKGNVFSALDDNHIIVGDCRTEFSFKLYSHQGELIREINLPFQKTRLPESYKEAYIKRMKTPRPGRDNSYFNEIMKKAKFKFPKYLLPYRRIYSDNKYLYAYRDVPDFSRHGLWILTYEGKILKKLLMPNYAPFSFHHGNVYYLQENEDEEVYELWVHRMYP